MKKLLRLALPVAVSLAFVAWTLHGRDVPGALRALRTADYRWLGPYLVLLLQLHLFRTLRFGVMVETQVRLGFLELNRISALGTMALALLPFRMGEAARPVLLAGRAPFAGVVATVVAERVLDAVVMALVLLGVLLGVGAAGEGAGLARVAGGLVLGLFGAALVALVAAARRPDLVRRPIERIVGRFAPRLAARLGILVDAFARGLAVVPGRRGKLLVALHTVGYWGANGLSMAVLARVFGIPLGIAEGFGVLGVLVVALLLPAAPGMVGTFQAGALLGLGLFVPPVVLAREGLAYANAMWLLHFAMQVGVGIPFFLASGAGPLSRLGSAGGDRKGEADLPGA
jgi:uncharacterized protein (TIRG00374 family)